MDISRIVTKSGILNNRDSQFYFQMYPFPILIKREYHEKADNTVIIHVQTNQYRSINKHIIIKHHIWCRALNVKAFLSPDELD